MTVNIAALEYRRGMLDNVSEAARIKPKRWVGSEIPKDVMELIHKDKILDLPGSYGDPAVGNPIEYQHLKIIHGDGATEIEYYNLGIAIFSGEDGVTQRIFRVMAKLTRLK